MLPLAIVIVGICVLAIPFVYVFYLGLLAQGANPEGSIERQDYDRLRASLAGGNLAARLYSKWLTKFLDWIERFFGDPGMEDRTLFPHAFGLRKPAPLWTAPAFDRCMFLALIYPISTIFLIWTISGHVGPAEAALGLKPNLLGWWRSLIATTAALEGFVTWTLFWGKGPKSITWSYAGFPKATGAADSADVVIALCAAAGAAALTIAFGSTGAGAVAFSVAVAASVASSGRAAGAVAVAVPVPVAFGLAFGLAGAPQSTVAWVVTVACACSVGLLLLCAIAIKHQALDVFLVFFIPAMIIACLAVVGLFAPLQTWRYTGPLLFFLGLLTLINAPFNWASLGLTRALLRRGLELGGWWPYLLALLDACLAGVIIALLAVTMVIDVQAFDELAVHGGGEKAAVLPLPALFEGIAKNPGAPEYWWAYALLLSTMIPSLINLAIGGMAFTRGIPGVGRLLLHWIPEGRDVPDYRRPLAAIGLTFQMFSGAVLGIAAQAFLAWGLLFHIMPAVGLDLLWLCQQLAELDLPGNFFHLTGIIR
jgi:hypothetical protein